LPASRYPAWSCGLLVGSAMALYYALFFFPPRLVGANDPDRFYHLGLSQLISTHGLLKSLPQVEDLAWGRYFPDKEFLFHALTGGAYWLAGPVGTLFVVPVLGIAIVVCLYATLLRVLSPGRAAILVVVATFLSPVLVYRLSLLRPHLLAILCFCLLLAAILRGRGWLAAVAAAGFALSYHAFYIPAIVIVVAAGFRWPEQTGGPRRWQWALFGLLCGIVLNPYFPSTLVMSWTHVRLALGVGMPAGLRSGNELQPISFWEFVDFFSFLPVAVLAAAVLAFVRRLRPSRETAGFWFLFTLSAVLTVLSFKSSRATEYAVPSVILLTGYCLALANRPNWLWMTCGVMALLQGHSALTYYQDSWSRPQQGDSVWYLAAIALIPPDASGKKIFTCEWVTGSYLLFARPQVRFVDLLEPALLWQAAPQKYLARERLTSGEERDPYRVIRDQFHADYVLCGAEALNLQLQARPDRFEPIPGSQPMGPLRLFKVRD
jgi:hypothetical protein